MLRLVGEDEDTVSSFPNINIKKRELLIAKLAFSWVWDDRDICYL